MIEKILNGTYSARLLKERLCDVAIVVWGNGEPATVEHISYREYWTIKSVLL